MRNATSRSSLWVTIFRYPFENKTMLKFFKQIRSKENVSRLNSQIVSTRYSSTNKRSTSADMTVSAFFIFLFTRIQIQCKWGHLFEMLQEIFVVYLMYKKMVVMILFSCYSIFKKKKKSTTSIADVKRYFLACFEVLKFK